MINTSKLELYCPHCAMVVAHDCPAGPKNGRIKPITTERLAVIAGILFGLNETITIIRESGSTGAAVEEIIRRIKALEEESLGLHSDTL